MHIRNYFVLCCFYYFLVAGKIGSTSVKTIGKKIKITDKPKKLLDSYTNNSSTSTSFTNNSSNNAVSSTNNSNLPATSNQGNITNSSSTTSTNNPAKEARGVQAFKPNNNPGDLSVSNANISRQKQLLPNEGKVGTYRELKAISNPGDNLTPHHIPSDGYMKKKGIKGYNRNNGVAIMVEHPYPGIGGRHRKTDTYGKKTNTDLAPRDELAKDAIDLREIYREDGLLSEQINKGIKKVIEENKKAFPKVFEKKK